MQEHPLAAWRNSQNPPVSPAALARDLHISRSFLSRLEKGERKAGTELLRRIKARCDIAPSEMRPDLAANAAMFNADAAA
jgi:transcriptional regulator with XRE-family HTH domain